MQSPIWIIKRAYAFENAPVVVSYPHCSPLAGRTIVAVIFSFSRIFTSPASGHGAFVTRADGDSKDQNARMLSPAPSDLRLHSISWLWDWHCCTFEAYRPSPLCYFVPSRERRVRWISLCGRLLVADTRTTSNYWNCVESSRHLRLTNARTLSICCCTPHYVQSTVTDALCNKVYNFRPRRRRRHISRSSTHYWDSTQSL